MAGEPVTMVRHETDRGMFSTWKVGDFSWGPPQEDISGTYRYCTMKLPSKVGSICMLPVREGARMEKFWWWNGSLDKPTFMESIHHDPHNPLSDHNWHGFVINGVMQLHNP